MSESQIGKPLKVALFRDPSLKMDLEFFGAPSMEKYGNVRVSEYVEVTFLPLADAEVAAKLLDALDITEKKIRSDFQAQLDNIESTRKNLLALTYFGR